MTCPVMKLASSVARKATGGNVLRPPHAPYRRAGDVELLELLRDPREEGVSMILGATTSRDSSTVETTSATLLSRVHSVQVRFFKTLTYRAKKVKAFGNLLSSLW